MYGTIRKMIRDMGKDYGEDFIWWDIDAYGFSKDSIRRFADELRTELLPDDPFLSGEVLIAAKCDAGDDMLFYSAGLDKLRIYHLTWSHCRESEGFPRFTEFDSAEAAARYIRQRYEEDYL